MPRAFPDSQTSPISSDSLSNRRRSNASRRASDLNGLAVMDDQGGDFSPGSVIRNPMVHVKNGSSNTTPKEALESLQAMFSGALDPDVVHMIFTESAFDFDVSVEQCLAMTDSSPSHKQTIPTPSNPSFPPLAPSIPIVCKPPLLPTPVIAPTLGQFATVLMTPPKPISNREESSPSVRPKVRETRLPGIRGEVQDALKADAKVLVLMRGLPGSGKSFMAKLIIKDSMALGKTGIVFSTDDYFLVRGQYEFDKSRLSEAHSWNQSRAEKAIKDGVSPVIIDNTNLETWEMKPYAVFALNNKYKIFFAEPETAWRYEPNKCARNNSHGIPATNIEAMLYRFKTRVSVIDLIAEIQLQPFSLPSTEKKCPSPPTVFDAISVARAPLESRRESSPSTVSNGQSSEEGAVGPASPRLDMNQLRELTKSGSDTSSLPPSEVGSSVSADSAGSAWEPSGEFVFTQNADAIKVQSKSFPKLSEAQEIPRVSRHGSSSPPSTSLKDIASAVWSANDDLKGAASSLKTESPIVRKVLGKKLTISSDWSIPTFPGEQAPAKEEESVQILVRSSKTQTESVDWALLELKVRGCDDALDKDDTDSGNGDYCESESDSEDAPYEKQALPKAVKLDKGTSVQDFPGDISSYDEKVAKLSSEFQQAQTEHLTEILDACHGDYQWAKKLLNDFNEYHFETDFDVLKPFDESRECSPPNGAPATDYSFTDIDDVGSDDFKVTLPSEFVTLLEKKFGTVPGFNNNTPVSLSHGVALLIHNSMKKVAFSSDHLASIADSMPAIPYRVMSPKPTLKKSSKVFAVGPARNVIEENQHYEAALILSREQWESEAAAQSGSQYTIATNLKRKELFSSFPGMPEEQLERLFSKHDYSLAATLNELEERGHASDLGDRLRNLYKDRLTQNCGRSASPSWKSSERVAVPAAAHIRAAIRECESKRYNFKLKASEGFRAKQYAVAGYYADEARKLEAKIKKLSKDLITSHQQYSPERYTLDLHGSKLANVVDMLKEFLEIKQEELNSSGKRKQILEVITGYGSGGTQPVIKPHVSRFLHDKGYQFEQPPNNPGCLRITLSSR